MKSKWTLFAGIIMLTVDIILRKVSNAVIIVFAGVMIIKAYSYGSIVQYAADLREISYI